MVYRMLRELAPPDPLLSQYIPRQTNTIKKKITFLACIKYYYIIIDILCTFTKVKFKASLSVFWRPIKMVVRGE